MLDTASILLSITILIGTAIIIALVVRVQVNAMRKAKAKLARYIDDDDFRPGCILTLKQEKLSSILFGIGLSIIALNAIIYVMCLF